MMMQAMMMIAKSQSGILGPMERSYFDDAHFNWTGWGFQYENWRINHRLGFYITWKEDIPFFVLISIFLLSSPRMPFSFSATSHAVYGELVSRSKVKKII